MAILSTGPIENNVVISTGIRPTQSVTVKIDGRNTTEEFDVLILGYSLIGFRTLYVQEELSVGPFQVITRDYFADLDAFEFVFSTTGIAEPEAQVSVWGKNSAGQLVTAHRLVSQELLGETGEGSLAQPEPRGSRVLRDYRELQELRVLQGLRVLQELQELQDCQGLSVLRG